MNNDRRKRILFVLVVLAVQAFIWRRFLTNSLAFVGNGDRLSFDIPFYLFIGRWLKQGVLPFWNPYLAGGVNILASPLYTPFYPPQYLIYLAPERLFVLAQNWYMFLHWAMSFIFFYIYARDHFRSFIPAAISSVIYSFSMYYLLNLGLGSLFVVTVYAPLALWCLDRADGTGYLKSAAVFGVAFGLQLQGGFIQLLFYVCILYLFYTVFLMDRQNWKYRLFVLVGGGFIGLALGSSKLIPMFSESFARPVAPLEMVKLMSVPDLNVLYRFLDPFIFGARFSEFIYKGDVNFYEALPVFSSATAVLLCLAGIILCWTNRDKRGIVWIAMIVISLLTVFGGFTLRILHIVWGENYLLHGRIAVLIPISLAMLSGIAVENLPSCTKDKKWFLLAFAPPLLILFAVSIVLYMRDITTYPLWVFSAAGLALSVFLLAPTYEKLKIDRQAVLKLFFLVLCFAELFLSSERLLNPDVSENELNANNDFPVSARSSVFEIDDQFMGSLIKSGLKSDPEDFFRAFVDPKIVNYNNLIPQFYEFPSINGYLNAFSTDFHRFILAGRPIYRVLSPDDFPPLAKQVFRYRYFIKDKTINEASSPTFPPYYFADAIEINNSDDESLASFYNYYNFNSILTSPKVAFVNKNNADSIRRAGIGLGAGYRKAGIMKRTPNTIMLSTDAASGQLLIVNEQFHDRWQAFIDGGKAEIVRTNFNMRGIPVPAGRHTVTLEYRIKYFAAVVLLTAAGLSCVILLFFLARKQKKICHTSASSTP